MLCWKCICDIHFLLISFVSALHFTHITQCMCLMQCCNWLGPCENPKNLRCLLHLLHTHIDWLIVCYLILGEWQEYTMYTYFAVAVVVAIFAHGYSGLWYYSCRTGYLVWLVRVYKCICTLYMCMRVWICVCPYVRVLSHLFSSWKQVFYTMRLHSFRSHLLFCYGFSNWLWV